MAEPTEETRSDFEAHYNESHRQRAASVTVRNPFSSVDPFDWFKDRMISMPCTCDDGGGPTHWAAIGNNPRSIRAHLAHECVLSELRDFYPNP